MSGFFGLMAAQPSALFVAFYSPSRERFHEWADELAYQPNPASDRNCFLVCKLACGHERRYVTREDVPDLDECLCGTQPERHYFVVIGDVPIAQKAPPNATSPQAGDR